MIVMKDHIEYGPRYSNTNPPAYQWQRDRRTYTQIPFETRSLQLPYRMNKYFMNYSTATGRYQPQSAATSTWQTVDLFQDAMRGPDYWSNDAKLAYNRAYSKLRDRLQGGVSDMLTLIRERKALGEMLYRRVYQVGDLVDEVRSFCSARGNTSQRAARHRRESLRRIGAILATPPQGVRKRTPSLRDRQGLLSTPAELLLELRWGWMPMVSDVYNALNGITSEVPSFSVSGSAGYPIKFSRDVSHSGQTSTQRVKGMYRVKVGGQIQVTNGMFRELERLGFSNPAQSLYETVPYSWLVDYFTSLGEIVSSLDDRLTGKMVNVYLTSFAKGNEKITYGHPPWTGYTDGWQYDRDRIHMFRTTPSSVPMPYLAFQIGLSPWRIATLISLVVVKLRGIKTPVQSLL